MQQKSLIIFVLLGLSILLLSAGCSKAVRVPGLVKCEGIVTWNGEPVEGARVSFIPKEANARSAFGMTDAGGKFKVTTLDTDDGIAPGEYVVTVTKRTATRGGPPPGRGGERDAPPVREQITETYFVPRVYSNESTSGLSAVVPVKGVKDLKFELVGEIENTPTKR